MGRALDASQMTPQGAGSIPTPSASLVSLPRTARSHHHAGKRSYLDLVQYFIIQYVDLLLKVLGR